jgi:hypothetical protein
MESNQVKVDIGRALAQFWRRRKDLIRSLQDLRQATRLAAALLP